MSYSRPQSPSAEVISYLVHACHLFHWPASANSQYASDACSYGGQGQVNAAPLWFLTKFKLSRFKKAP